MEEHKGLEVLQLTDYQSWLSWLAKNFGKQDGIWLKFAKKGSGVQTINYEEAREGALIYGWIDGLVNSLDEKFYLQRFTPRRPKGTWSKINVGIVDDLIKAGKMQPSGMKEVEAAKADGRWAAAYEGQATMPVPADLKKLLKENPKAAENFELLNKANRYAILYRLHNAVKPETREKVLAKALKMLLAGESFH
jgi:uncharacterized protein YdeI (YjbR/CyaY-like superfamily)